MGFARECIYQEILPYFGLLDDVYILMRSYSTKTSEDWDNCRQSFETHCQVQRKTLKQEINLEVPYFELTEEQKLVLSLFKLKSIHLTTDEKYQDFMNFVAEVPDKFSLAFDKIYLGNGNHENVMSEATCTKKQESYDKLINSYTAAIDILFGKGLGSSIESYCDITRIKEFEESFVNTIVINLAAMKNILKSLPFYMSELTTKRCVKFNHVLVFWCSSKESQKISEIVSLIAKGKNITILGALDKVEENSCKEKRASLEPMNACSEIISCIDEFKQSRCLKIIFTTLDLQDYNKLDNLKNQEIGQKLTDRNSTIWFLCNHEVKQYYYDSIELCLKRSEIEENSNDKMIKSHTDIYKIGLAYMELIITDFSNEKQCKTHEFSNPLYLFCQNKFYTNFGDSTLFLSKLERSKINHNLIESDASVLFFDKSRVNKNELLIEISNDLEYCDEENIFPKFCEFGFDKIKINFHDCSESAETVTLIINMSVNFKDLPIIISGLTNLDIISLLMRDRVYPDYNTVEIIYSENDQLFKDILSLITEKAKEKMTTKFTFKNEEIF